MNENTKHLRRLMAWHGMKACDVGVLIHRSPGTVRQYMCGKRNISSSLVDVLASKCEEISKNKRQTKDRLKTDCSHDGDIGTTLEVLNG